MALTGGCCFQLDQEPERDTWDWYPFYPSYQCDPAHWRCVRALMLPDGHYPHLCESTPQVESAARRDTRE